MIAADKDALICDLAETYGVFDMRALPVNLLATLSVGLRANSRIRMAMSGAKYPDETMLLASVLDGINILLWMQSKDGADGINRPGSVLRAMLGISENGQVQAYDTAEEYEAAKKRILEG